MVELTWFVARSLASAFGLTIRAAAAAPKVTLDWRVSLRRAPTDRRVYEPSNMKVSHTRLVEDSLFPSGINLALVDDCAEPEKLDPFLREALLYAMIQGDGVYLRNPRADGKHDVRQKI